MTMAMDSYEDRVLKASTARTLIDMDIKTLERTITVVQEDLTPRERSTIISRLKRLQSSISQS